MQKVIMLTVSQTLQVLLLSKWHWWLSKWQSAKPPETMKQSLRKHRDYETVIKKTYWWVRAKICESVSCVHDGLVQERCNSIANALELRLSCTDPSICDSVSCVHNGLVQEGRNSIANALELRLSCTNPSICDSVSCVHDGLVQERRNSIANALELRLSCTNPSICESVSRVHDGWRDFIVTKPRHSLLSMPKPQCF